MKKAHVIAKAFLKLSQPEVGDVITNLKLQKLLYYVQGFSLAIHDKPIFEEKIVAWQYGPVIKEVYDEYKEFGAEALPVPEKSISLTKKESKLVSDVWNVYGQFSAWRLRDMTHSEMPWKTTNQSSEISHSKLKNFFKDYIVNE